MRRRIEILLFIITLFTVTSCHTVTIKIEDVPANTPQGSHIYISGNFNNWNPADPNYVLEMKEDSSYYVDLPYGIGMLRYKFTRGNWENVETDECGNIIDDRVYNYSNYDTIINRIECWEDKEPLNCPTLTIIVDKIPENTPKTTDLRIAGNFNEWNPFNRSYILQYREDGKYQITLMKPKSITNLEFKFTRGDISKVESDKFGNELPNRIMKFGITDTIYTSIENWEDLSDIDEKYISIILDKVPDKTYSNDKLYLVGNFNGWYPRDRKYVFEKNSDGKHFIKLPRKDGKLEFKVTRGDWETQELDKLGFVIYNREYKYRDVDEIHIKVENWADRNPQRKLVFKVYDYPINTPKNDDIYIVGNFNGWDSQHQDSKLLKTEEGDYTVEIEIENKRVEYKFTRGGWKTEETNKNGYKIENRIHNYIGIDTIYVSIKNWYDVAGSQNTITMVVTDIPEYTPANGKIFFTSNLNDWNPGERDYVMKKKDNKYYITLRLNQRDVYYKFTRGNWRTVEGDRGGGEIENRHLYFKGQDTIYHKVRSWKDLHGKRR